jgi:hypothetical protein
MKENKKEREKAGWKGGSELNIYGMNAWSVVDFNAITVQDVRGTGMETKRTSVGFVMQVNSLQMLSKGTVWVGQHIPCVNGGSVRSSVAVMIATVAAYFLVPSSGRVVGNYET